MSQRGFACSAHKPLDPLCITHYSYCPCLAANCFPTHLLLLCWVVSIKEVVAHLHDQNNDVIDCQLTTLAIDCA